MCRQSPIAICLVALSISLWIPLKLCQATNLTVCDQNDYKFEFTECDSLGGRWRVSVPVNPYKCSGSPPPTFPVRVNACYSSCSNGQFYNLRSLLCEDCPIGHYSLGGGIIIDNFNVSNRLPRGFHIITESTSTLSQSNSLTSSISNSIVTDKNERKIGEKPSSTKKKQLKPEVDQEESGDSSHCQTWVVDSNSKQMLITSGPSSSSSSSFPYSPYSPYPLSPYSYDRGCISALTYTVRTVKSGSLNFSYRYLVGDEHFSSLLFTFHYKLYGEGTVLEDGRHTSGSIRFPAPSLDQSFDTINVDLTRPGLYVFTWKAIIIGTNFRQFGAFDSTYSNGFWGSSSSSSSADNGNFSPFSSNPSAGTIRIKKIQIEGVAYASECTPCEPGLYSNASGSQQCSPCPKNTFSPSYGAYGCQNCDPEKEYSYPGSSVCKERPICGKNDLYSVPDGNCDPKTGNRTLKWKWIKPKICIDSLKIIDKQDKSEACKDSSKNQHRGSKNKELCDPGMEFRPFSKQNPAKLCQFCASENYYRSGSESENCIPCPPFTTPVYEFSINRWNSSLPGWSFGQESLKDFETSPNVLTSLFSRQCLKPEMDDLLVGECDPHFSWQPFEDYIRTGPSASLDSFVVLTISLSSGFRTFSGGEITFTFETICNPDDRCSLLFVETRNDESDFGAFESGSFTSSPSSSSFSASSTSTSGFNSDIKSDNSNHKSQSLFTSQNKVIKEWLGSSDGVKSFAHRVTGNISASYSFVFKRTNSYQSFAKIKTLSITNAVGAPAIKCQKCDEDARKCLTCPKNQYLAIRNSSTKVSTLSFGDYSCVDCPPGTVTELNSYIDGSGIHNLQDKDAGGFKQGIDSFGNGCYSDCSVKFDNGDQFDLSSLSSSSLQFHGTNLFTVGGTQYRHLFNIRLCSGRNTDQSDNPSDSNNGLMNKMATCVNNVTEDTTGIRSLVCRSTLIPEASQIFSTQAISLGDELLAISRQTTYKNITVNPEFLPQKSQRLQSSKHSLSLSQSSFVDYYLFYSTKTPTIACPRGRRMTLTMRCSPEIEKKSPGSALISAPKSCPEGTCDGCNFHLLLQSGTSATCRICREFSPLDYQEVAGECIDNRQVVHYLNPKNCVPMNGTNTFRVQDCTVELPRQVQIGIAMSIFIALVLLFLVLHFWTRNRSLEYKYSRLVEGSGKGNGDDEDEIAIDNCCVEEMDDEDDDVGNISRNKNPDIVPGISFSNALFEDRKASPKHEQKTSPKNNEKLNHQNTNHNNRIGNNRKALGNKKEIQGLFASNSPIHSNGKELKTLSGLPSGRKAYDEEGYETIHLTSGHSFDSNQLA